MICWNLDMIEPCVDAFTPPDLVKLCKVVRAGGELYASPSTAEVLNGCFQAAGFPQLVWPNEFVNDGTLVGVRTKRVPFGAIMDIGVIKL